MEKLFFQTKWLLRNTTIRRISGLLLIVFFLIPQIKGSNSLDSLENLRKFCKSDTQIVSILILESKIMLNDNPEESLKKAIEALRFAENSNDLEKIGLACNHLGILSFYSGSFSSALENYLRAISAWEETGSQKNLSETYTNLGVLYSQMGNNSSALEYFFNSLQYAEAEKNDVHISRLYNNIGLVYLHMKDYVKADDCFQKSLKLKEKLQMQDGIAGLYNNMGEVYRETNEFSKALEYYQKSLNANIKENDVRGQSQAMMNIALIYKRSGNLTEAITYLNNSIKIKEALGSKAGIALAYFNLGEIYRELSNMPKAKEYLHMSEQLAEEIDAHDILLQVYNSFASYFEKFGPLDSAYNFQKKYIELKEEVYSQNLAENIANYQTQFETIQKEKEIEKLNQDKKLSEFEIIRSHEQIYVKNIMIYGFLVVILLAFVFIAIVIVLYRQKKMINSDLQQKTYELQQKNEEIQSILEKLELANLELEKQNSTLERLSIVARQTNNAIIIMDRKGNIEWVNDCLLKLYGVSKDDLLKEGRNNIIHHSNFDKIESVLNECIEKRSSVIYEAKTELEGGRSIWTQTTLTPIINENHELQRIVAIDSNISDLKAAESEINKKNELLNRKNNQIISSIDYAKRIQNAILPQVNYVKKLFSDAFLFFQPKDIVSGDFYWGNSINNKTFFAVADCTGHGVPGAFMSIIGAHLLEDIIIDKEIFDPGQILSLLHSRLQKTLNQENPDTVRQEDGMEISLICFDSETKSLKIACTSQCAYVFTNKKFHEIQGDVFSIGDVSFTGEQIIFETHEIQLNGKTTVYLASDGYHDQFGGPENKKFMTSRFKSLLQSVNESPFVDQEKILRDTFNDWKKNANQIDDVIVAGLLIDPDNLSMQSKT